jgi:MoaA/NifB/PqqE/SkfB family radical SAM enzyme
MSQILASFAGTRLRLNGFPYCFLGKDLLRHEYMVANGGRRPGAFKASFCSVCVFNPRCTGFPAAYSGCAEIRSGNMAIPDRPVEVLIEVETGCQFDCHFCFNQNTFAPENTPAARRRVPSLGTGTIKNIFDQMAEWGVRRARFTGGEPLLRGDLLPLMDYACEKGISVWLNTNGYRLCDPKLAGSVSARADNILLSLRGWDPESDCAESHVRDSFQAACAAARALRASGLKTLRIGTCATKSVIENLDLLYEVVKSLAANRWEFYRPVAIRGREPEIDAGDLKVLVDRLLDYQRAGDVDAYIANPLPFCFYDAEKVNMVSLGAILGEGNNRFIVDPSGACRPGYYMDVVTGESRDLRAAWDGPFSRAIRNLELLPSGCAGCFYAGKCRGGSRHAAKQAFGDYRAPDPLATFNTVSS